MSSLLDALKRAEQEKLARRGQEPPSAEPAEHEPGQAAASVGAPRRQLELESHAAVTASAPAVEPIAANATRPDRESAKAVFTAKQAVYTPPAPATSTGRNKTILAIVIAGVALTAAGGAYVWYEINAAPGPMARAPLPVSAPRPVTPAASVAPQSASGGATESIVAPKPTAAEAAASGSGETVPAVAVLKPEQTPAPARPKPQPKAAELLVMNLLKESANAKPAQPLKLARTIEQPRVSPDVAQGYEALVRGDAVAARRFYESAVVADSTSLDAHLGLAAAAARTGDRNTAASHYRRTLALDPKNASAIAGMAALADFSRPEALEAQLRADITRYPQSPALHFTLGNLYASQSRWNEAQAAYFDAYRLDPESADLAFNLAVSLDHLGQTRPAADFYQRALAAARKQTAQFDKGQVARRIAELKP